MDNRISWTNFHGHRFLIADFSSIQGETEYLDTFDKVEREILQQPKGTIAGMVVDITHSKMTPAISSRGRKLVDDVHAAGIPDYPTVVVGGSSMQKTVVSAIAIFRHDVFVADTREQGLLKLANYLENLKSEA